jgi:hypothetical protein
MKNVMMNGPMNALRISLSNFFIMPRWRSGER